MYSPPQAPEELVATRAAALHKSRPNFHRHSLLDEVRQKSTAPAAQRRTCSPETECHPLSRSTPTLSRLPRRS